MLIRFACETCRRVYELPHGSAGRQAKCECGQMLVVPSRSTYTGRTRLHANEQSEEPPPPPVPSTPPPLPGETPEVVENAPPPLPEEAFGFQPAETDPVAASPGPASDPQGEPPESPSAESFSSTVPPERHRCSVRGRPRERRLSFVEVLLAFFDWRLRSYITPYLLRFA